MKTAVFLLTLIFAIVTFAEVINVPEDFETIQGAIDAAEDGDTVLVAPGEYVENVNFEGKAISLIGNPEDPSEVIIDGDESGSVVTFVNGEERTSILIGFTIRNGLAGSHGGGIYCNGASPTIRNCHIRENSAGNLYGGGICLQQSEALIEHCEITDNLTNVAGGGLFLMTSSPTIFGCLIARNSTVQYASGIYIHNGSFPRLINCTLSGNRSENELQLIYMTSNSQMTISNSIITDNQPNEIHNFQSTLEISYSYLQGGEDNIEGNFDWGEGNIDEDPLLIDIDEGDYHLSEDSPCIDTGDPESPEDPDGTRADMGAFPFQHIPIVIEGIVFDALSESPIENAKIETSYGISFFTGEDGFYHIPMIRYLDLALTASMEYYYDSTRADFELEDVDTLTVNFGLKHAELIPSEEEFTTELEIGDSASFDFSIRNDGDGLLEWSVSPGMRDAVAPWQLRETISVGDIVDDPRVSGVVLVDDQYYLSGGGSSARDDNFIYVLSRDGELLDSYHQLGQSRYGMGDLAWDGELIWGGSEELIYGFNVDGDSVTTFETDRDDNQAIAWDSDRELLWTAGKLTDHIIGYNREGVAIDSISQLDMMIYGLAYYPDDPDGYPLYVTHRILARNADDYQALHKINPNENDTMFVAQQYSENGELGGMPEGILITDQLDPCSWVMLSIVNNSSHDRLDIWQVEGKSSWMRIEPVAGIIDPEEQTDIVLTLDATDLTPFEYPGELRFTHNGFGGETSVAVDLTVSPSGVSGDAGEVLPTEFSITSVYPNPFNSSTTIKFYLPTIDKVRFNLYDVQGRLINLLPGRAYEAGDHHITIDATNLATGVYIVRLTNSSETLTQKIVLMR